MATAALGLPMDPRAAVFRRIVTALRNDPVLRRVVKAAWYTWDGGPNQAAEFGDGEGVAIRLTPQVGAGQWQDESGQSFPLVILVDAIVPGTDADDPINLQGAIESALYQPLNLAAAQAFRTALVAAGALDGLIDFMPLNDPRGADNTDGAWGLRGQLRIDVRRIINP